MFFKAKVVSHKMMSDHIAFRLLINKDGQDIEVFSKSYVQASTPEKTDIVLGMTRKRLALMGLDMETCTDAEWDAFVKIETLLGGKEVEIEEKDNPPYGIQYDILTNAVADDERANQIRNALRGIKGRPRAAAPSAPARPSAPAAPRVQQPLPGPKPLTTSPTPAPAGNSII